VSIPQSHLAQEAIAALVDGELPSGPAHRAAKHLLGCAQCRFAVAAQREAKEALHRSADVAVPGDLLSRLRAIPFTTDVPGGGGGGTLAAGPDQLTLTGESGSFAVSLSPTRSGLRPDQARWLRRGVAGTIAALGVGVVALTLSLPGDDDATPAHSGPVARSSAPEQHTTVVPPVVRTIARGTATSLPGPAADGTP
jgi:hypothetical protein